MCIGSDMKKRPPIETTVAYCGRSPNLAVRASHVSTPQRANQNGVPAWLKARCYGTPQTSGRNRRQKNPRRSTGWRRSGSSALPRESF
jgi:hypothetical protein